VRAYPAFRQRIGDPNGVSASLQARHKFTEQERARYVSNGSTLHVHLNRSGRHEMRLYALIVFVVTLDSTCDTHHITRVRYICLHSGRWEDSGIHYQR
jgi:hypothetical protein